MFRGAKLVDACRKTKTNEKRAHEGETIRSQRRLSCGNETASGRNEIATDIFPFQEPADPSEAQRKEDPQEIIELESPPQQMSPICGASVADLPSRNRQNCETVEFGREVKAKPVEKHPMQPSACDGKCPLYGHIVALYGIYIIKVNRHLQKRIEEHFIRTFEP
ncbi:unnamed protein product [Nesidiocoris tenuis]|uniref:Uncharacterized protein n=1 Tax=Nesidiocoris tenuis TaxID=355587 RepID=A0A6H5H724_9HEMI|nr:unnamed protein product [Nesidiocoris tenuis]CAB0009456.1 unnamed protein product [Nesidiocoris tenuis]